MESRPVVTGLVRSMQYMDPRNGGLLVDFKPIKRYMEIAPGENHYERVRTVLDWVAFGADLGLLAAPGLAEVFADPADAGAPPGRARAARRRAARCDRRLCRGGRSDRGGGGAATGRLSAPAPLREANEGATPLRLEVLP